MAGREGGNTCLIQFQEHARRRPLNFSPESRNAQHLSRGRGCADYTREFSLSSLYERAAAYLRIPRGRKFPSLVCREGLRASRDTRARAIGFQFICTRGSRGPNERTGGTEARRDAKRETARASRIAARKTYNFALTFVLFAFLRLRCSCRVHANGFRKCNGTRGWNRNVGGSIGGTIRCCELFDKRHDPQAVDAIGQRTIAQCNLLQ